MLDEVEEMLTSVKKVARAGAADGGRSAAGGGRYVNGEELRTEEARRGREACSICLGRWLME